MAVVQGGFYGLESVLDVVEQSSKDVTYGGLITGQELSQADALLSVLEPNVVSLKGLWQQLGSVFKQMDQYLDVVAA